ncbi:acyl carrier protein [Dethiothermospora halolimnae]|uniref:acyl carrier protein n=1 Tax=Dethiothermospora halolimnae TaxID=3114390 RepID=UPI003CCB82C3
MDKIFKVICEVLNISEGEIDVNTSRDYLEEWDSLAHIQIIAELEEQMDISIPFEEVAEIKEVKDFKKYI